MEKLNYLEERALFYSLFVSQITESPLHAVYKRIRSIFLCEDNKRLECLIKASELTPTNTYHAIALYTNFIDSFCTDPCMFGMQPAERALLDTKHDILLLMEEFKKAPLRNQLLQLHEHYKELELSTAYAMVLYFKNQAASDSYLPVLRKAIRDTDGLDASISLLYFEPIEKKQECLRVLEKNKALLLYPELCTRLAKHYNLGTTCTEVN